jgi:uncharacterized protein
MRCPRCSGSDLDERVRDGVTIDVCMQCRGIWLDRGELEKLTAREQRDYQDYYNDYERYRAEAYRKGQHYPGDKKHYGYKRPKTFLETLGDIFD